MMSFIVLGTVLIWFWSSIAACKIIHVGHILVMKHPLSLVVAYGGVMVRPIGKWF